MNRTKQLVAATGLFFLFMMTMSCSIGLDPAKSASDTTVSIQISSLSPSDTDRAIIQGPGFLYIQTGSTAADAKLYGPLDTGSGKLFLTKEIPAGTYNSFSIFYLESQTLTAPVLVTIDNPTILSALQSKYSDDPCMLDSFSCATLSGVVIQANRINSLKATLLPATTTTLDVSAGSLEYIPSATAGIARRFFRIEPITAISAGQVLNSLTITLVSAGPLSVSRVAVYGLDGSLLGVDNKTATLTDGLYDSWNIPAQSLRDTSCYLYVEYEGSVDASSQFSQTYINSGRSIWYVSNSGGSDGSDAAHPCTLDQAVACVNNTTYSGTSSIILTETITTVSKNFTFTKDVRLSSLGTAPCAILYRGSSNNALPLFQVGDGTNVPAVSFANCTLDGGSGSGTFLHCLVSVQSGSLTLDAGATLQNNGDSILKGGAVKVNSSASAVMLQGSCITGCSAGNGGAVDVLSGTFTMEGGSILSCTASTAGGAVYIEGGLFTMKNGYIGSPGQGCSAQADGGAIGLISGTFTMEGGTISDCSATGGNGGALYESGSSAKANLNGGTITGCKAPSTVTANGCGGAVYLNSGLLYFAANSNVAGTVMSGNTVGRYGTILYKATGCSVFVNGITVPSATVFQTQTGYDTASIYWN